MSRVACTNCGGGHAIWDCKRPAKKSTAPKIEILGHGNVGGAQPTLSNAGEPMKDSGQTYNTPADVVPPVDTNSAKADNEPQGSYVSGDDMPRPQLGTAIISPSVVSASQIKRPRGRPKSITDMKAYKAAKQREYRAKWKGRE